jgi:hypothetical protein
VIGIAVTLTAAFHAPARADGWIGRWSPGIGDPTLAGWLTVVAYFVTAWLVFAVVKRTPSFLSDVRRERMLWLLLAWLFVALGVNKQLDLQSAVTELGRIMARDEGWYAERREVQREFVALVALVALVAATALVLVARGASTHLRVAIAGTVALLGFVVIRAASFHHVDVALKDDVGGFRTNWLLEVSGITVVMLAALSRYRLLPPFRSAASRSARRM